MVYRTSKETQMHKDARRKHIILSASRLFAQKGYKNTSIKNIVEETQLSVGTFYFYFKNKEELFQIIYDQMIVLFNKVFYLVLKNAGSIVRGFCRSKTSELWLFQRFRGIAKAFMVETAGMVPSFETKRSELFKQSNHRVELIFENLIKNKKLEYSNPRTAALLCNGTMYSIIMDWLLGIDKKKLTDYALPIINYNLNAFKIKYSEPEVKEYIKETIMDMDKLKTECEKSMLYFEY